MLLKFHWYNFKLEYSNSKTLNVISMVTTKKIIIEYTQKKMRKELKYFTTKRENSANYKRRQK